MMMIIDKGAEINETVVQENFDSIIQWIDYWIAYPDIFMDLITPNKEAFSLFFYQRIFMRVCMRYTYHFATFTRAFSKSFLAILTNYLSCIFLDRRAVFLCSDTKKQSVDIAKQKLTEIWARWPILRAELLHPYMSTDYINLVFRNGSQFDIIGSGQTTRGLRYHGGILEEAAKMDEVELNEVILPLVNISRRDIHGKVLEKEINQSQTYITTAGPRACFAYEKLIDLLILSIIKPQSCFIWGGSYRIPLAHGLLAKEKIDNDRLSPTFKEESFAREYMSIWTGTSEESWFNSDRLTKYRKLLRVENKAYFSKGNTDVFYLISVDVARYGANSAIMIFKVLPQENSFKKKLVNTIVLNDMHFNDQACLIKQLVRDYCAKEVVVDGTGLGAGLIDFLTITTVNPQTGEQMGPLGVINDEDYIKLQAKDIEKVLYVLKASANLNSDIHSNCFTQVNSGHVVFLAHERVARSRLLATKKGQKMPAEKRAKLLLPYEMTTRLFDEIANLRMKPKGSGTLDVERISTRLEKDRFSSFEYGLWRIKEYEDQFYKQKRKKQRRASDFIRFTPKPTVKSTNSRSSTRRRH